MTDRGRDPKKVGPAWMALYALQGDEPLEWVGRAALEISDKLARCDPRDPTPLMADEIPDAIGEARLFTIIMGELFGELENQAKAKGEAFRPMLDYRAKLERRKAGKPVNRRARARVGLKACRIVAKRVEEGMKVEAAIAEATEATGLSRAEINQWRAHLKRQREAMAKRRDGLANR